MKDKDLQDYFRQRLTELPEAELSDMQLPAFEAMFSPDELAPSPELSPRADKAVRSEEPARAVKQIRWWPAVAAAAVVALFVLLFDFNPQSDTSEVYVSESASVSDAMTSQKASAAETFADTYAAALQEDAKATLQAEEKVLVAEKSALMNFSENAGAHTDFLNSDSSTTDAAEVPESLPFGVESRYERSIEEAYAEARQQKKRAEKKWGRVSYGFGLQRNNGLLSSAAPVNKFAALDASPVSNVSRFYGQSALRSASVTNQWKMPSNLTSSQMRSYKPVYHYPLSLGLSLNIPLWQQWSLQTGLTYTYLLSETTGSQENASTWELRQALHYVGIPLSLRIQLVDYASWELYAAAGGGVEKALCGVQRSTVHDAKLGDTSTQTLTQKVAGLQLYSSLSVGLAYTLASRWQLYVEPGLHYYYDNNQPLSIRTKKPLNFNLGAGLRIAL